MLVVSILLLGVIIMTGLERLRGSVLALTTVTTSAVALLGGLAQEIRDNVDDPEVLDALADEIDSNVSQLSAAVTTNTAAEAEPDALVAIPPNEEGIGGVNESSQVESGSGLEQPAGESVDHGSDLTEPDAPVEPSEPGEPSGEADLSEGAADESQPR